MPFNYEKLQNDYEIVNDWFLNNKTQKELAKKYNKNTTQINQLIVKYRRNEFDSFYVNTAKIPRKIIDEINSLIFDSKN